MKARVREVARWCAVGLFGVMGLGALIGGLSNLNTFVGSMIIFGVCLLLALLLIFYRPRSSRVD